VSPFTEPVKFSAGSLVGKFYSVQEENVYNMYIGSTIETAKEVHGVPTTNDSRPLPEPLVDLYENACDGCESNSE